MCNLSTLLKSCVTFVHIFQLPWLFACIGRWGMLRLKMSLVSRMHRKASRPSRSVGDDLLDKGRAPSAKDSMQTHIRRLVLHKREWATE
jgi:hypothetical protein